jgi:hypothetical protein
LQLYYERQRRPINPAHAPPCLHDLSVLRRQLDWPNAGGAFFKRVYFKPAR